MAHVVREFSLKQLRVVEQDLRPPPTDDNPKRETGVRLEIVGGFRRGKPSGHDVDFLLGHDDGIENDLLAPFLDRMRSFNLLILGVMENSEYTAERRVNAPGPDESSYSLDRYKKSLTIMKVPRPETGATWEDVIAESGPLPNGQ